jgi:hypothetical protein
MSTSIIDLWREAMALSAEYDRLDEAKTQLPKDAIKERERLEQATNIIFQREYALRDVAMSQPARTIGDAAVHVELALSIMDDLDTCDFAEHDLRVRYGKIIRLLSSALPQVARVAGIALSELGGEWGEGRFDRAFPCVEAVAA